MAGLRHNPNAPYCTKRTEVDPIDPDAICDYCQARGLGPQPIVPDDAPAYEKFGTLPEGVNEVQNATGEPEPVAPGKPLIVQFFDKLGIVKGQRIDDVRTVGGHCFHGTYDILEVNGLSDSDTNTLEAVITLREPGMRELHRVVWSHVTSFTTT